RSAHEQCRSKHRHKGDEVGRAREDDKAIDKPDDHADDRSDKVARDIAGWRVGVPKEGTERTHNGDRAGAARPSARDPKYTAQRVSDDCSDGSTSSQPMVTMKDVTTALVDQPLS